MKRGDRWLRARVRDCAAVPASLLAGIALLAVFAVVRDLEAKPPPDRVQVAIDGGSVTVRARDAALADLLEEIARQGGLVVDFDGPVDG